MPAATHSLVLTTPLPTSVTAGSTIDVKLVAEDRFGNIATQFNGAVAVALKTNTGNSLLGTLSMNAAAGIADFSDLKLDKADSGYTIQATSGGLTSATTNAFSVMPAAASILVIRDQPTTSVIAGMPFDVALVADDQFGNLASQFTGNISVAFKTNTGSTLLGTLNKNATLGMADFSDLILQTAAKGYMIQATSAGLTSNPVTASFEVLPAAVAKLVVTNQPPGSVTAGSGFDVRVVAQDKYDN